MNFSAPLLPYHTRLSRLYSESIEVNTSLADAFSWVAYTIASTATVFLSAGTSHRHVLVRNNGNQRVFIGGSGVTTSTGMPLDPGESLDMLVRNESLYGIVASGSCEIRLSLAQHT